ncbi:MAG: type I DNA topoisomerase [Planctomycetes bacterium]|nr:type I DNA topoisomerase [Planctomycetota bacterium]
MAKKKAAPRGKPLVIVESPAKARTIGKFLGSGYNVAASIGHVRDLPKGAKEIPARYKGEDWAYLGVNVNDDFKPIYITSPGKAKQIKKLKDLLKNARELYLATDEDREGEAISWHLQEVLKPTVPVHRLVFHEITKEAITKALESPRQINLDMVRAQEARRILDRLYGYEVSPLLWRKIRPKLSAGRVQSVAVRLIVERERARMAFVSATYFDLLGLFATAGSEKLEATLISVDGRNIPAGKDFDTTTGKLKNSEFLQLDEAGALKLLERLRGADFRVVKLEDKPYTTKPYAPFTTSTMQQESNRKLGFTARRTMQVAQSLYENGHITYMRTDSTNLAKAAIDDARSLVSKHYGQEYLPDQPRVYKSKVKNAQEAHEAIRPAGHPFEPPESLKGVLNTDDFRLFELIWKRTIASQMADARGRRIIITIEGDGAVFRVSGKTIDFPGYLRAYVEGSDDPEATLADQESLLPNVKVDEALQCRKLESKSHTTQPPGRYSEASLTRALEEMGIGRPSTYASIIDTIQARDYVFKKGGALVPTWVAISVSRLLEKHLPGLVDYQFTAQMEDDLDTISRGETEHVEYLRKFYFGNGEPGLKEKLKNKAEEIDARDVCSITIGQPEGQPPIVLRVGRYGPFLQQGDDDDRRRASLLEEMAPADLTLELAMEMLDKAAKSEEPLGVCPETHKQVFLKIGRFGPYIQRGNLDDEDKPKNASLLKGMEPEDVDLALALKLLTLPRELGVKPDSEEKVSALNGRFGPYIKCGSETRSLPAELSPLEVTLAEALHLLAQPKKRGRGAKKEPIKVFDKSPITDEPVQLLDGRYGPYVTDGTTNASLPRDEKPEEMTLEKALDLLAERAAKSPAPKKKTRKKAVKKKSTATRKKVTKKKAVSAKKKSSVKKK